MPASQAKTIDRMLPLRPDPSTDEATDFLPFHARGRAGEVAVVLLAVEPEQHAGDREADAGGQDHRQGDAHQAAGR
jgi:hypothetical protein